MGGFTQALGGRNSPATSFGLGTGGSRPNLTTLSPDFNAGGLESDTSGTRIQVTSSGSRQRLIKLLSDAFGGTRADVTALREQVRPGFSAFRREGLAEIENRRSASVGNLRENLARRRVQGSSFAEDALTRAEAEFAQEAATFSATSTLQELDTFFQLTNSIGELRTQEIGTLINELNLQADIALALQGRAAQALSNATTVQQQNAGAFQRQLLEGGQQAAGFAAAGCWFAREVYGKSDTRWIRFRNRMVAGAPQWFKDFYQAHGEMLAGFIHRFPVLKRICRPLMDRAWR